MFDSLTFVLQAAVGNKNMPILQCHGDCDPIVPLKWGQLTASILKSFAKNTELKTYRGLMHSSSDAVCYYILLLIFLCINKNNNLNN